MADQYPGEIRTFAFPFAPNGWAPCEGQLLPTSDPTNAVWAAGSKRYAAIDGVTMSAGAVTAVGGNSPHNTMQPYLPVNVCIALVGEFPPH
jgi:microcystin-dependent protein